MLWSLCKIIVIITLWEFIIITGRFRHYIYLSFPEFIAQLNKNFECQNTGQKQRIAMFLIYIFTSC